MEEKNERGETARARNRTAELQRRKTRPPGSPPRASRLSFMIKVLSHHSHISRTVKITNGALIGHPETRPYIYGISRIGKKKNKKPKSRLPPDRKFFLIVSIIHQEFTFYSLFVFLSLGVIFGCFVRFIIFHFLS